MTPLRLATLAVVLGFAVSGIAPEARAARARNTPPPPPPPPVEITLPAVPPLFSAKYSVEADGFKVGEMRRELKAIDDDTYALNTRVETVGLVSFFKPDKYVERSEFRSTVDGYVPLKFSSKYTGRSKDVVERVEFDWDRMEVHSLRDRKEKTISIEPGLFDKLMYQVEMQSELSRGITQFRYRVVDRSKIEEYKMEVVGEETVSTVLGKQRTVKVRKGTTMIWCAVDLDYVPVMLQQREDGHTIATYLTSLDLKARASPRRLLTAPYAP